MSAHAISTAIPPESEPEHLAKAPKFIDSPYFSAFYVNNVGFAVNQLDIILHLGEIIDLSPQGEPIVERKARVTMNPSQARALSQMLEYAVKLFESQNGPVRALPMNLKSFD